MYTYYIYIYIYYILYIHTDAAQLSTNIRLISSEGGYMHLISMVIRFGRV